MADIVLKSSTVDGIPSSTAVLIGAESAGATAPNLFSLFGVTGVYNVKAYGATGDGSTTDTTAIQAAIDAASTAGGGIVVIPPGTYRCNLVYLKNNVYLWSQGAWLKQTANAAAYHRILSIGNSSTASASNCGILGHLNFDGDRANQTNVHNSGQYGIWMDNCSNVYIQSIYMKDHSCDGILFGDGAYAATNVTIDRVITYNCWRNGLAICGTDGLHIKHCETSYTNGAGAGGPQAGVDIEPDNASQVCRHVCIDYLRTYENSGYGLMMWGFMNSSTINHYDWRIKHLVCHDNASGVWIDDVRDLEIASGEIFSNTNDGIYMAGNVSFIKLCADMYSNGAKGANLYVEGTHRIVSRDIDLDGCRFRSNGNGGLWFGSDNASYPLTHVFGRVYTGGNTGYGITRQANATGVTGLTQIDLGGDTSGSFNGTSLSSALSE
jgi:hypothetical protein